MIDVNQKAEIKEILDYVLNLRKDIKVKYPDTPDNYFETILNRMLHYTFYGQYIEKSANLKEFRTNADYANWTPDE